MSPRHGHSWRKLLYLIALNGHFFLEFIQLLFEPHKHSTSTTPCGKAGHSLAVHCVRKDVLFDLDLPSDSFIWCPLSHIPEEKMHGPSLSSFPVSLRILQSLVIFSLVISSPEGESWHFSRSSEPYLSQSRAQNQTHLSRSTCPMDSNSDRTRLGML